MTKSEYWNFVDQILDMAEQMGLYIGLVPAWGSLVKANILNMETMRTYANFLGKRYQNRKNLIWILGGDVRGDVDYDVFCLEGEILKSYNPERIVAYHPFCGFTMSRGLIWICFSQDIEDTIRLLLESGTTMRSVRHSLARTIGNMWIEIFLMTL